MRIEIRYTDHVSALPTIATTLGAIPRGARFSVADDACCGIARGVRIERRAAAAWLRRGVLLYVDHPSFSAGAYPVIRAAE